MPDLDATRPSESLLSARQALVAFPDSDWSYYVPGHDPAAIAAEFGPDAVMEHEPVWMRAVRASSLDYYDGVTTLHEPETGRYEPVMCWIECPADHPEAEPWMGVRHSRRPEDGHDPSKRFPEDVPR